MYHPMHRSAAALGEVGLFCGRTFPLHLWWLLVHGPVHGLLARCWAGGDVLERLLFPSIAQGSFGLQPLSDMLRLLSKKKDICYDFFVFEGIHLLRLWCSPSWSGFFFLFDISRVKNNSFGLKMLVRPWFICLQRNSTSLFRLWNVSDGPFLL